MPHEMTEHQKADFLAQVEAATVPGPATVYWSPVLTYPGDIRAEVGQLLADTTPFGEALKIDAVVYDPELNESHATFRYATTADVAPMIEQGIARDRFLASLGVFRG